jgi:methionyl-tRNA formyltransferase
VTDTALAPVPEFPRRLVYLGTPEMAVPPLEALVRNGFEVALVVTGEDKRRGRGSTVSPCPVKRAALDLGCVVSHRVEDVVSVGADLGVVVAFGRLIRRPVLEQLAMVNIHFSLLPRWRGAAPVERALLAGDTVTGTCLMQLEEGLDTGPVFDTVQIPIRPRATADELRHELVEAGTEQLLRCLSAGLRNAAPQVGEPTYAAKLGSGDLHISWSDPVDAIDRQIRVGAAWTEFRGRRMRICAAAPSGETRSGLAPGQLVGSSVVCGGGALLDLDTVQPEGKGPMSAISWRNGVRIAPDESFGTSAPDEAGSERRG